MPEPIEPESIVTPEVPPETPPPETPPAPPENDAFKRLQADFLKEKAERKRLADELENQRITELTKKQKWEEIAKIREQERDDYKQKHDGLIGSLVAEKKFGALKEAGLKAGIRPEALPDLELLDFDEVSVEHTSNGKILVTGALQAIANLKTLKPHWFSSKPATVNSQSPQTTSPPAPQGSVSMKMLLEAEAKYKKSGSPSDRDAYAGLARQFNKENS